MTSRLAGKTIAILVANGFDENQMTEIQRALTKAQAKTKIIAPEQGVVNGWQGAGWGHYFPIDAKINEALGSDFDALILPGGERAVAKLKSNLHTRRIVGHFLEAGKPIAAIGAGVGLLALCDSIAGRAVAAPAEEQTELAKVGAEVSAEGQMSDDNLLTSTGEDIAAWVQEALGIINGHEPVKEAA